jgi:transposase
VERDRRIAQLEARIAQLEAIVEQLRRGGKRQAAPFSKGLPKADPKKPGRKPGPGYGTRARRRVPSKIDETHEAPLPDACPHCDGTVHETHVARQYQSEIPRRPIHRQFNVHVGVCDGCGRRVQGRHELQTSDALGAAASQLGPDAQALIVHLNKQAGLSHGKIRTLFQSLFGIDLSRGGSCQSMLRSGRRSQGHYQGIVAHVRQSRRVVPDETGWRIGGSLAWLHVAAAPDAVAYRIDRRRGFEASARLLGEDYSGTLVHDGWSAYRRFWRADHQTCLGHLLVRCKHLLETAVRGAVIFPRQVQAILREALAVRDERDAGRLSLKQSIAWAGRLQARMQKRIEPIKSHGGNERLAAHLWKNRRDLFTFLRHGGVDATNWRAEQALRPAVVNRKVWGGNRTESGAQAQSVLLSVLQTATLLGKDAMHFLSRLLCAPAGQEPLLIPA